MDEQYIFHLEKMQAIAEKCRHCAASLLEVKDYMERAMLLSDRSSDVEYQRLQKEVDEVAICYRRLSDATMEISADLQEVYSDFARRLEESREQVSQLKLI